MKAFEKEAQRMREMEKEWFKVAEEEMEKLGLEAEAGLKALAFHDTGQFEDSMTSDKPVRNGSQVSVEVGSNDERAIILHERPYRMGTHDKHDNGAVFPKYYLNGRGRRTLTKPNWRGFKAGRKYMDNMVNGIQPDVDATNKRILDRVLENRGNKP